MNSSENLIEVLGGKKQLKDNKRRVLNKLKKQEKLTSDEFWLVYNTIWQKGPEIKYKNPDKWVDTIS